MRKSLLIGRQPEMAALSGWLEAALDGRPRLVLCGGEPGIGKSRLAAELAQLADTKGVAVAWARAPEGVAPPPFWLWRQVLRSDGELPAPESVHPAGLASARFDPNVERFAMFEVVTRQVFAEAETSGMLVVVDDVQWADQPSLVLLLHLARNLRDARLLVVATHRSRPSDQSEAWKAVMPNLVRQPVTEELHLRGLSVAETTRFVSAVTESDVEDQVGRYVHRLTGGNPFFVREVARARAVTGSDAVVPRSVLDVVGQQVERLSAPSARLLEAAAVLGEQFPVPIAASLLDRPVIACLQLLEEAADAGLLEPSSTPGDWRFAHALVREAVEARIPMAEGVRLHRAAAEAIERTFAGHLGARLADLARHWAAVAVTGERGQAVHWARRAAEEAMAALAYEEGARLYRLALDVGGAEIDDEARCQLLLALATAHWRSAQLEMCREACREVVSLGRRLGRPDVVGDAALTMETVGTLSWDLDVRHWCEEALAGLDEAQVALRARLLARLSEASVYVGEDDAAAETSRLALELADHSDDVDAVVAALRARQLARSGPEHVVERTALADRMTECGVVLRRPVIEMWGRLWKIDAHWERGELSDITASIGRLQWCVEHVGGSSALWHHLVVRAGLAQALGRFSEATELGAEAFASVGGAGHPTAIGAHLSLLGAIGHHTGQHQAGSMQPLETSSAPPIDPREVRGAIFAHLGPAFVLAEAGRLDEAEAAYRRAGPAATWRPPPYFRVLTWAVGCSVAMHLGERDDVGLLRERLEAERGRHAVGGAGNASYLGPVELYLGRSSAFLGRFDAAEADLEAAASSCRANGAVAFAAEADCELASVLLARGADGDLERAQTLATRVHIVAARLGMEPWTRRAATISASVTKGQQARATVTGVRLSARETEVADLVAEGKTNREIATALFVAERTAQTHVQHILTKLGYSNRSQIVTWVWTQRTGSARSR